MIDTADDTAGGIALLSPEQGQAIFQARLNSKDWWLLIPTEEAGSRTIIDVEHRFYAPGTPANADFEAAFIPYPKLRFLTTFYFAKKTRMSAAELAEAASVYGGRLNPDDDGDIVFLGHATESQIKTVAAILGAEVTTDDRP